MKSAIIEAQAEAKPQLQHMLLPFTQAAEPGEDGLVSPAGFLVTYGEVNANGWLWVPGAARDSLKERRAAGRLLPMGFQHDWMEALKVIGVWNEATDSVDGVYGKGKVSDTSLGRDASTLVKDGAITGISVGFYPTRYQYLEPGQRVEFDTPYGKFAYEVEEWCIAVITAHLAEASLVHEPADDNARIDSFQQSLEKARRALPGLAEDADAGDLQYSMALLMGGRGAAAFDDLDALAHQGLYQRLAAGYARQDLTPPDYERSPNYRDVAFQHDERRIFSERYLQKSLAGFEAGAGGIEGPLSPETREQAERTIAVLQELVERRTDEERIRELAASLRQTTQLVKEI